MRGARSNREIREKIQFSILLRYLLVAAQAALFVAGRDNGPVAFALLEKCKQYFKCTVRHR
jgi:hypothetical protein